MKALSLTSQKLWPMLKFICKQMDKQTEKRTNRQTGQKLHGQGYINAVP